MLFTKALNLKKLELTDSPADITELNSNFDTLDLEFTNWTLEKTFEKAGQYTFTVPNYAKKLGVVVIGGGGGATSSASGASGYFKAEVINDFKVGQSFTVVVGKGGRGARRKVNDSPALKCENGGSSSFGNIIAEGGGCPTNFQSGENTFSVGGHGGTAGLGSTYNSTNGTLLGSYNNGAQPQYCASTLQNYFAYSVAGNSQGPFVNPFDPNMPLCASGCMENGNSILEQQRRILGVDYRKPGYKGYGGLGVYDSVNGGNASGNGNGGGTGYRYVSVDHANTEEYGSGSEGVVLVYIKK